MDYRTRKELRTVAAALLGYGVAACIAVVALVVLFALAVTWFDFPLGLVPCAGAYAAMCLAGKSLARRWPNVATAVVGAGAVGLLAVAILAIVTGAYVFL